MTSGDATGEAVVEKVAREADDIAAILRERPGRFIYLASDGRYYITHEGPEVVRQGIDEALAAGLIEPRYPDAWNLTGYREEPRVRNQKPKRVVNISAEERDRRRQHGHRLAALQRERRSALATPPAGGTDAE